MVAVPGWLFVGVFGVGFAGVGAYLLWVAYAFPRRVRRIKEEWDVVDATLTKVDFERHREAGESDRYSFDVEYEYGVDGRTGDRVYPVGLGPDWIDTRFRDESVVTEFVESHEAGDRIRAHVDPSDRSTAYLTAFDPEAVTQNRTALFAIGGLFLTFGLAVCVRAL